MRTIAIVLILAMITLTACEYTPQGDNSTPTGDIILEDDDFIFLDGNETDEDAEMDDDGMTEDEDSEFDESQEKAQQVDERDVAYTITVVEGDLVKLDLEAEDPDGDSIDYSFTEPLNEKGRWQTNLGDEGRYLVTITASDGKLSTSEDVLVVVGRANRAPVIECPEKITVKEGEKLEIECNIFDEEGDNILVAYDGWVSSDSKLTTYDDAGEYTVLVRASDGNTENSETLEIVVENVNRAPVIEEIEDVTVMETNRVVVSPLVSDEDGDEIFLSYGSPLNSEGEWLTQDGDSGSYDVTVTATDGSATAETSFTITVTQINTAPVLKPIDDIEVDEGDTIELPVNAYDPEGDELIISYSGFMATDEYETTYTDAGVYEQTVTVSDGVLETSQSFSITIADKNRPPVFRIPGGE